MSALDEIVKGIIGEYDAGNQEDAVLATLIRRIREGNATYADVGKLASRTGTRAGRLIAEQLAGLSVDGRVTEEQARALLTGMTRHNYDIVSGAAADVQESLNRRAGLGLKAVRPAFNSGRVEGLVTEVAGKEDVPAFGKTLIQQIENVSVSTVDESVRANAEAHYNAGMYPRIVRIADSKCCEWCSGLAGTYEYSRVNNTGNDVFRRHASCRCQVLYDPADGKRWQDAHSKRLLSADDREKIKARISSMREAAASKLTPKFAYYIPDERTRKEIIRDGVAAEKPIYADGLLGKLAKELPPEPGKYDIVMHGHPYHVEFFGQSIDVETLCAIIAQRKDYRKGMDIRLISCYTGSKSDGVAQYIANKLRVTVWAPDKQGIILKKLSGEFDVYSGSRKGVHDGNFVRFDPQ